MASDDPTVTTSRLPGSAEDAPPLPSAQAMGPQSQETEAAGARAAAEALEPYEPPQLMKFEKLDRLIVSGE